MTSLLVTSDEKVELTGKTVLLSADTAKKPEVADRKPAADPFFEIKSPRAIEGDRVTVTLC